MKIHDKYLRSIMNSKLFKGCESSDVLSMLSKKGVSFISFKAGEYIMRAQSDQHLFGILLKGNAVVERKSEDGLMHMSRLSPCDLFGAASVFSDETRYVVDIRCISDCRVISITEDQLVEWFQENAAVMKNYLRYLNNRIRFLNRRLDALSKNNVSSKLMSHFITEATDGVYLVNSYTELSEMLCLSRATMYRALDSLCVEGKIARDGKKIILLEEK